MDIYIPLALYIIAVSILLREHKKLMFTMVFIPLLLFWGTREDFGTDYFSYRSRFENQHGWDFGTFFLSVIGEGKLEPGFFLLTKLVPNFNSMVFICSLIYTTGIAFFFYKFVPQKYYPLSFVLLLFSPIAYNAVYIMRSSITLSLFLMAYIAKIKGNRMISYILALISATFHMSGIFLVLLLLLKNEVLTRYHVPLSSFVCFFVFIALLIPNFWSSILNIFITSVDNFSNVYGDYVHERNLGIGFYFFSLIRFGFIVYILSLLRRKVITGNYIWIAWMTILYYSIQFIQNVEIIYRFSTYLYFITITFQCYVLKVDKTKLSKFYIGLSIIYIMYNFVNVTMNPHTLIEQDNQQYHSFLF